MRSEQEAVLEKIVRVNVSKKILLAVVIVMILIAGGTAAYFVDRNKTLYHFRTVDEGKVYRSGCLTERGLTRVMNPNMWNSISGARNAMALAPNTSGLPRPKGKSSISR
jgi:predicted ribosomally synthesized peptide with SipW-like signal peptide